METDIVYLYIDFHQFIYSPAYPFLCIAGAPFTNMVEL